MAHPKRARFVKGLKRELPGARVVWDEGDNDRWSTGRRALLAFDPAATHHLVIQDDAIPSRNLLDSVCAITERVSNNPISLYTGKTRPFDHEVQRAVRLARARRLSWLVIDELFWGVGVVIPVPIVQEMISFHDRANIKIANYDSKMSFFFKHEGVRVYYTLPSLVDHRCGPENPSLVPGRTAQNRVARWFLEDPSKVNWDTKVVYMTPPGKIRMEDLPSLKPSSANE